MIAREWSKPLIIGGVIGAALFAAALGYLVVRQHVEESRTVPHRVAVIIVSRDTSDSPTSQAIALAEGGTLRFVSPDTEVAVPGTSAKRLADAYSFGGGALVASLLPKADLVPKDAYIAIPEDVWVSAITESGIEVDVPERLEVFDGGRLVSLDAGTQTLSAADVAALLRALPFIAESRRDELREGIARSILSAMSTAETVPGVESGLSARATNELLRSF